MENASKALIIAGAILISILIIGLGMYVYQQAAGVMKTDALTSAEKNAYNSKFTNFEGTQSGASARQLCSTITSHNITAADSSQYVTATYGVDYDTTEGKIDNTSKTATDVNKEVNTARNQLRAGKNYKVTFTYDAQTGYVVGVGFQEVGAGGGST